MRRMIPGRDPRTKSVHGAMGRKGLTAIDQARAFVLTLLHICRARRGSWAMRQPDSGALRRTASGCHMSEIASMFIGRMTNPPANRSDVSRLHRTGLGGTARRQPFRASGRMMPNERMSLSPKPSAWRSSLLRPSALIKLKEIPDGKRKRRLARADFPRLR
jgi:hypothetical protein